MFPSMLGDSLCGIYNESIMSSQYENHWPQYPLDALCRKEDPETFFPVHERQGQQPSAASKIAIEICHRCIVQRECLDTALDNKEPHGIWGGLVTADREKILRKNQRNRL